MTVKLLNLQDSFLNQIRKENIPVIVYLANGFQLRGSVRGFDSFTVILKTTENSSWYTNTPYPPLRRFARCRRFLWKNATKRRTNNTGKEEAPGGLPGVFHVDVCTIIVRIQRLRTGS